MFDYVSQREFDLEHELRVRAEADALSAREEVKRLTGLLESEHARHAAQITDLLDRFKPKPQEGEAPQQATELPFPLSQLMWQTPAIGRRGAAQRQRLAHKYEQQEEAEEREAKRQERRAGLSHSDEEKTVWEKKPATNFARTFLKAYKKANGLK